MMRSGITRQLYVHIVEWYCETLGLAAERKKRNRDHLKGPPVSSIGGDLDMQRVGEPDDHGGYRVTVNGQPIQCQCGAPARRIIWEGKPL